MPPLNSKMDCSLNKWSLDFIAKNRSLLEKHLDLNSIVSSMKLKKQQMKEINELISFTQNREGQNQIFIKFLVKNNQNFFKKFLRVLSEQQKVLYNILQNNEPKEEIGNRENKSSYCLSGYQTKNIVNNYINSKNKILSNSDFLHEINDSIENLPIFKPAKSFSTSEHKMKAKISEMYELNADMVFRPFNKLQYTTTHQNTYIFCCDFETFSKAKEKPSKQCKKLKKSIKHKGFSKKSNRRYLAVRRHSTKPPPLPPKPRNFSHPEVKQQYKGNIPFEFRHNEAYIKKYVINNDSKNLTDMKKEGNYSKMNSVSNQVSINTTHHFNTSIDSFKQQNLISNTSIEQNAIKTTASTLHANNSYIESIHHKKNKINSKQQITKVSPNDTNTKPTSVHHANTPPSPHNNIPSHQINTISTHKTNSDSPHEIKIPAPKKCSNLFPQHNNSTPPQKTNNPSAHHSNTSPHNINSNTTEQKNFDALDINIGFDYNLPGDESNDENIENNNKNNVNNNNTNDDDYDAEIDVEIGFDDDDDVVGNYYHVQKQNRTDVGESGYDDVIVQENINTTTNNVDNQNNDEDDDVNDKNRINNTNAQNDNSNNTQKNINSDADTQNNSVNINKNKNCGGLDENDYQCYDEDIKLPVKSYNSDEDDDSWYDDYDENLYKDNEFLVFDEPLYEHIENVDDYDGGGVDFGHSITTGHTKYRKSSHHNRDGKLYDDVKVLKKGELLIFMREVVEIGHDNDDDDDKSCEYNDVVHNDYDENKIHELDKDQIVEKINAENVGVAQNLIDNTLANCEAVKDSTKIFEEISKGDLEVETFRKDEVSSEEVHINPNNQRKYSVKNNIEKFNSLSGQKKESHSNDTKQEHNAKNIESSGSTEHQPLEHFVHDKQMTHDDDVNVQNDKIEIPRKSIKTPSTYMELSDKRGNTYLVPQLVFDHLFKKPHDHTKKPWFHPLPLRPLHASLFLKHEAINGAFVVYEPEKIFEDEEKDDGSKSTMFILSVYSQRQHCTLHYNIKQLTTEELVVEGSDQRFDHLTELVEYYRYERGGLALRLKIPLKYSNMPISQGIHYNADLLLSDVEIIGVVDDCDDGIVEYKGRYGSGNVNMLAVYKNEEDVDTQLKLLDMAHLMRQLRHESVLKLVGIVDEVDVLMLVTEQICDKTLQHLLDNRSESFSTHFCFDICMKVVNVMEYLEVQKVILRDLSPSSFHLCVKQLSAFSLKLTGLKQARKLLREVYKGEDEEMVEMKRAAIEVLENLKYSVKSDVWAFGVFAWEIFSLFKPFQNLSSFEAAMFVLDGGRLDRPEECPVDFYWLLLNCWKENPIDRPSFKNLKRKLLSQSETILSSNASHWSMDSLTSANKIHSLISLPTNQAPPLVPRRLSDKGISQQDVHMTTSFHDNNSLLRREKRMNNSAITIDKIKSNAINSIPQVKQLLPFHLSKHHKEGSQSPKIDSTFRTDPPKKHLQRYSSRVVEQVSRQEQLNKHLSCHFNKASLMELTIHEDNQECHSNKCTADNKHVKVDSALDNKQNNIDSSSNEGFDNSKGWRRSLQKKFSKNNKYKVTN